MDDFPHSRASAQAALDGWLDRLPQYASRRNHVDAASSAVSRLSPAIRHRLLLESEAVGAACERWRWSQVEKWVQEIVWRTYWKGWLELRPQVWSDYLAAVERLQHDQPERVISRAHQVASGQSGVAVMDRFARQLVETGYLHNHARMWWAGFWIHVERLPWELGAAHFLRHLIDADAASNTLSWRWVAGIQTPGKAYLPRRSNLEKYCDPELLDDSAGLDRLECVEAAGGMSASRVVSPAALEELPSSLAGEVGRRCGLWIHEDDLGPPPQQGTVTSAVLFASATCRADPLPQDGPAARYRQAAMQSTASGFDSPYRVEQIPDHSPESGLPEWIARHQLDTVVAWAPFVGPLADRIPEIRAATASAGARLVLCRREWDASLFPHAKAGYFPFWHAARRALAHGNFLPA